jgi:hypothetical protein
MEAGYDRFAAKAKKAKWEKRRRRPNLTALIRDLLV